MEGIARTERSFSDVKIRAATNRDVQSIRRLVFDVLIEHGLLPDPEVTDADLLDIEENYLKRGGTFEVIEDAEGNLAGTVGLYPVNDETCELRKMYFALQVRGRGLGLHILERVVNSARERGFKKITLETSSRLEKAIRLYTRFGFKPYEAEHRSTRSDCNYFLELQ
jgi:putative acetyltransferase